MFTEIDSAYVFKKGVTIALATRYKFKRATYLDT